MLADGGPDAAPMLGWPGPESNVKSREAPHLSTVLALDRE